jgi:hypothetical protein
MSAWGRASRGMLILAGVACVALVGPGAAPASASCAGPQLSISPSVAGPGTKVVVTGRNFVDGCNDTGGSAPGPLKGVELVVRVGDAEKAVGRIDVADDFDFVIDVQVPPSLGMGTGSVIAVLPGQADRPPVSAPLEVAGPPGDLGDWPYLDFSHARSGSAVPWAWIALGALVGGAGVLLVTTIAGRRRV